jgi:transposase
MTDVFVGIDVSKDRLDVAARPSGQSWQVPNTEVGVASLVEQVAALAPTLVVLEATGRLESATVGALAVAGIPLAVVNPRQVRDFARATGKLAKTDALDAQMLARFAEAVRPTPRPLPDATQQRLEALLVRRRQLLGMCTAERNRRRRAPALIRATLDEHLA